MVKAEIAMETSGAQLTNKETYESWMCNRGHGPLDPAYQTKLTEFNYFVKFGTVENNGGEPLAASPPKAWDVHMGCQICSKMQGYRTN